MLRVLGQALPPDIADELGECEFAFDKSSAEELLTHGSKYSAYYFTATTRYVSFYFPISVFLYGQFDLLQVFCCSTLTAS